MIGNCYSLVLCSTSHHGLQLEKGMYQGGHPFALDETGIQYQYTHAKSMILSLCQITFFKKQQSHSVRKSYLGTIYPQPPPSSFFFSRLVSVQVVHPYSSINTTATWKKLRFILSVRYDFHMIDSLLIAVHAFVSRVSICW